MLATFQHPSTSQPSVFNFLPSRPSPLSPRSANIHGPRFTTHMSSTKQTPLEKEVGGDPSDARRSLSPAVTDTGLQFPQRRVKTAHRPSSEEFKQRRRTAYLNKVRENRHDKRHEVRGEDMLRLDFMQRQKAWEAELERSAPTFLPDLIEQENEGGFFPEESEDLPAFNSQMQMSSQWPAQHQQEEQVDEFLRDESEEIEALVAYMSREKEDPEELRVERTSFASDGLWSDDTDYDAIFSEVLSQEENPVVWSQRSNPPQMGGEEMDMS